MSIAALQLWIWRTRYKAFVQWWRVNGVRCELWWVKGRAPKMLLLETCNSKFIYKLIRSSNLRPLVIENILYFYNSEFQIQMNTFHSWNLGLFVIEKINKLLTPILENFLEELKINVIMFCRVYWNWGGVGVRQQY